MLTAADLLGEPLEKYSVSICVNLPAPEGEAADRLRNYVANGGNLVWICGENVDPTAYNRMNEAAGGQLLPAPLGKVRAADVAGGPRRLARQFPRQDVIQHWPIGRSAFPLRVDPGYKARADRCRRKRPTSGYWPRWTMGSRCWSSATWPREDALAGRRRPGPLVEPAAAADLPAAASAADVESCRRRGGASQVLAGASVDAAR